MLKLKLFGVSSKNAGDTIVEVLIAVVVLGLALAIAYNLALKNSANTQLTQERSEALQIAQSQIEFLRIDASAPTEFTSGGYICYPPGSTSATPTKASSSCNNFANPNGFQYSALITGSSVSGNTLFDVKVSWLQYNVNLYYEL